MTTEGSLNLKKDFEQLRRLDLKTSANVWAFPESPARVDP